MRQWLNANDFRMILAEDDTEKLWGYQGKIISVSGARVIPCPSAADEPKKGSDHLIPRKVRFGLNPLQIMDLRLVAGAILHPFPGYLKFLFWRARNKGRSNEEVRMNRMNLNIAFPFYSRKRNLSIWDTFCFPFLSGFFDRHTRSVPGGS